jgi:hypothetical protein
MNDHRMPHPHPSNPHYQQHQQHHPSSSSSSSSSQHLYSTNGITSSVDSIMHAAKVIHQQSPNAKIEHELLTHSTGTHALSPAPPAATAATARVIDDNYDEDVVSALVSMSGGGGASDVVDLLPLQHAVTPNSVKRSHSPSIGPQSDASMKRSRVEEEARLSQESSMLPPVAVSAQQQQVADVTVTATTKAPMAALLAPTSVTNAPTDDAEDGEIVEAPTEHSSRSTSIVQEIAAAAAAPPPLNGRPTSVAPPSPVADPLTVSASLPEEAEEGQLVEGGVAVVGKKTLSQEPETTAKDDVLATPTDVSPPSLTATDQEHER